MKILVLSDSHGNVENMIRAVERESPRAIFHLGDCWRDGQRLRQLRLPLPGGRGAPGLPGGQTHIAVPRPHLRRQAVSAHRRVRRRGAEFGRVPLRPHPPPPGGHAGQDPLFEPRQYRRLRSSLLRGADPLRRQGRRPDRPPGLTAGRRASSRLWTVRPARVSGPAFF